jgi:hypothetical protein
VPKLIGLHGWVVRWRRPADALRKLFDLRHPGGRRGIPTLTKNCVTTRNRHRVASQDKAVVMSYGLPSSRQERVSNDTSPFAYNADAAALAWSASIVFLAEALTHGSS